MPRTSEKRARAANIFDVARLAGVSHQTVSRVINDLPRVRPATRERVEQAIRQLNYVPSPAARALVTKRTRMIGLIAPNSADYGPSSIALHFSGAARDARYGVITVTSVNADASSIRPFVESLLSQRVEAIVLVVADVAVLSAVRGLDVGVPVIAVAAGPRRGPLTTSIDQYRGARTAVRHLVELGHTKIAHLAGPQAHPDAIERLRGWRDELQRRAPRGLRACKGRLVGGERVPIRAALDDATAVFVANDQMALGLVAALHGRGLSVPGDISIVGFDAAPETAFYQPPLTTVAQDFAALGSLTLERVLIALEEPDAAANRRPFRPLVVRESTAPPRRPSPRADGEVRAQACATEDSPPRSLAYGSNREPHVDVLHRRRLAGRRRDDRRGDLRPAGRGRRDRGERGVGGVPHRRGRRRAYGVLARQARRALPVGGRDRRVPGPRLRKHPLRGRDLRDDVHRRAHLARRSSRRRSARTGPRSSAARAGCRSRSRWRSWWCSSRSTLAGRASVGSRRVVDRPHQVRGSRDSRRRRARGPQAQPARPEHLPGHGSIFADVAVTFFAYAGFRVITNAAEVVDNPERTIPRAIIDRDPSGDGALRGIAVVVFGTLTPARSPRPKITRSRRRRGRCSARRAWWWCR